jgi:hypothetical protein
MKWLFKWLRRLVLLVVLLVVLLFVFKDSILRVVAEQRIRSQTGMDVKIGKLSAGIFSPVVTIENLKLYNTAEFGGTLFLDVPELHIECDPVALAQRKLRITLMRLNLAELAVVKNELGQTNVVSLMNRVRAQGPPAGGAQKMPGDFTFAGIDVLNLTLGRARFIDLKDARNNREIRVDLQNQVFKNVKSESDLYGILFLIWLRSGGHFAIKPLDIARDVVGRKADQAETGVRQAIEQATAPLRKK